MFRPATITQAIELAKLQETSIEAISKKTRVEAKPGASSSWSSGRSNLSMGGYDKRELTKESEEKKAKGLCFKCNDKYSRGHVCKRKQLYALEGEEEEQPSFEGDEEEDANQYLMKNCKFL